MSGDSAAIPEQRMREELIAYLVMDATIKNVASGRRSTYGETVDAVLAEVDRIEAAGSLEYHWGTWVFDPETRSAR